MKRTRLLAILAIAVVAGLLVTGCERPMGLPEDLDAEAATHWVSDPPEVHTIWAGLNTNVGSVSVWNTPDTVYIKYEVTGKWWLEETHAHAALKLTGIPQRYGVPRPYSFEFKNAWHPRVKTCTYAIPVRAGWEVDTLLYIATHSVVVYVRNGRVMQREEGWAGPYYFADGPTLCHGPRYIKYKVKDAYKDVDLPKDSITMSVHDVIRGTGPTSEVATFVVTLSDVPGDSGDYDVWNGLWRGWCTQLGVDIADNVPYRVWLWSTQDPSLPLALQDTAWDNINYLINHKVEGATAIDIQKAVWYLRGDIGYPSNNWPRARQMIDDAVLNGNGWHPGTGQWVAVLMDNAYGIQLVFIEVDP